MADIKNQGIIYVLVNEAMPGYIKIGKTTTSVEQRVLELSRTTSVPLPFECVYAVRVADMDAAEKALHEAFDDHRKNPKREFFILAPERAIAFLKYIGLEEVTPSRDAGIESKEDAAAIKEARERRAAFNFKMVDISPGAILTFTRDENVTCRVAPDFKHVEFQDETMSLSRAAQIALGSKWLEQGPAYWKYHGEILDDRRIRLEEGDVLDNPKVK
ncbi:MAG: GIY-YIG nuclease family protein [Patescibacteria group bacterium]|nr:GIY-YIG nuclease family protein [Patescibacteria group bacterium]